MSLLCNKILKKAARIFQDIYQQILLAKFLENQWNSIGSRKILKVEGQAEIKNALFFSRVESFLKPSTLLLAFHLVLQGIIVILSENMTFL